MVMLDPEDKWAIVWSSWTAAFIGAEVVAIRSECPQAPLSYFMRKALGVRRNSTHDRIGRVVFAMAVSYLAYHLWKEAAESCQLP